MTSENRQISAGFLTSLILAICGHVVLACDLKFDEGTTAPPIFITYYF
jgi:hypothetical protein